MTRILCILSSLDAGGAETFIMKISRCLPTDIYQIDFIVSKDNGCYTNEVLERGGHIYSISQRRQNPIGALKGIMRIVRDNNYAYVLKLGTSPIAVLDLIAAKFGGASQLAVRSCNAPTGLTIKQKCINAFFRPVLNRVATIKLAPSTLAAEFTFGKKQAKNNVHLINNGVSLDVFHYDPNGRAQIRDEFSLNNKLVIGHVGRFQKQKNHRFLLEAFHAIREERSDAVLLLVGTGELESQIRELVGELGMEPYVIFAGVRFDIPQILSAMDVMVFPSLHEGMPNTVIEAQATGLPCILADTITKEANITGLVQYLPLIQSPHIWADAAIDAASQERRDTTEDFIAHGYDINSVSHEFIELICNSI